MDWHGKTVRFGAVMIAVAVVLRLFGNGGLDKLVTALTSRQAVSVLLFLETGHLPPALPKESAAVSEPTAAPTLALEKEQSEVVAVFEEADAALVEVNNVCGYETDVAAGLTQSLQWDLKENGPTVLILHSHATESYENTEGYSESGNYRTQDVGYNVVSVGDRLVQVLEAGGIQVVHDRNLHDSPSYSDAYGNSRESVQDYLAQYPTIRLVLDIHRDSVADSDGDQMSFSVETQEETAAQLMLVVGTDASGLSHPDWPENMSLAVKLHAQLERSTPGICRPISFRSQRFNQDLSPGALIVEVGAAGNTRQEALAAVELLGQAIIDLSAGTK